LKKLCDKGVFINESANIRVLLNREELITKESRDFINEVFAGSLPRFITTFTANEKLSTAQIAELKLLLKSIEDDTDDE
jgi:predicted transcriptional regulator